MQQPNRKQPNRQQKKTKSTTPNRTAVEIIDVNPVRRSRSERTMLSLTTSSYPHYLIGNMAYVLYAADPAQCKKAVDIENKFGLLDFIREVSFKGNERGVVFTAGWLRLEPQTLRIDNLGDVALTPIKFEGGRETLDALRAKQGLMQSLVENYHRGQVRGMTRANDINAKQWRMVEKKLTLSTENAFAGIGRSETVYDLTATEAIGVLNEALAQAEFDIQFTAHTIRVVNGDSTREITYIAAARA